MMSLSVPDDTKAWIQEWSAAYDKWLVAALEEEGVAFEAVYKHTEYGRELMSITVCSEEDDAIQRAE